jgi:nitric oxide reductase subunit B
MNEPASKELLISKGWIQAVALVMLFGFFVMGMLAYYTYTDEPPIPKRVIDPNGNMLFTGADVTAGQEVFLKNGLMEYGSIFGHGRLVGTGLYDRLFASRRRNGEHLLRRSNSRFSTTTNHR